MWSILKAVFWTAVVCVFLIITPVIGAILTCGTMFFVIYLAVKDVEVYAEEQKDED